MQQYISTTRQKQKAFFHSGATLALPFRKQMLRKLSSAMHAYENALADALWQDLHKSYEEAYLTELSIVYGEIRNHLRHLRKWARPERKCSPLAIMPATSKIVKQPLGNTLIIAPWNYPVQSTRRSYLVGVYSHAQAFALCSECISSSYRNDSSYFLRGVYRYRRRQP